MIIIHTVLANGQCLMPRVLQGILNQSVECCLMVITSRRDWSKDKRYNITENWTESFKYYDDDIFVGMDSDVVLTNPDAVKILVEKLRENKDITMVTMPSKPTYGERVAPHQLFAIRVKDLFSFEGIKLEDLCQTCQAINRMKKQGKKIECIKKIQLEECARKFVKRSPLK